MRSRPLPESTEVHFILYGAARKCKCVLGRSRKGRKSSGEGTSEVHLVGFCNGRPRGAEDGQSHLVVCRLGDKGIRELAAL
jgi:hypothetical protein